MEDQFLVEVIDPVTKEPLPPGETGELVITTLTKEAQPLIRYRTRDITRLDYTPCRCGRSFVRMAGYPEQEWYVCSVCGYTVAGGAPDKCPVCQAQAKAFFKVD